MYNIEEYKRIIRERLSDYRYYHSLCVSVSAAELAERYGADIEKARVAGILHDATKETPEDEQLDLIKRAGMTLTQLELEHKKFYHQASGAAFAKVELGITDGEILSAIRYHTTGKADMTLMEEIIYLADFISADRDYHDVDVMRAMTTSSKEEGMLYGTRYTISSVVRKGKILHPETVEAYNWILKKYFKNKNQGELDGKY